MTESTTVYFVDTKGSHSYHFDRDCPALQSSGAEVRTSAVYHSRRVGNPEPVKERSYCRYCRHRQNTNSDDTTED